MEVLFDGTYLANQSGIGRDARNLLRAAETTFPNQIKIVMTKPRFFSRFRIAIPMGSRRISRYWGLRPAITGKPDSVQLPRGTIFIQPHLHGVAPVGVDITHIVRLHDIFPLSNPEWFRWYSKRIFKSGFLAAIPEAHFICDSKTTLEELRKFRQADAVEAQVAYCPIEKFSLIPCRTCTVCRGLSLPDHYLIAVGTLEPRKNYKNLILGWEKREMNSRSNAHLIICGRAGWKSLKITKYLSYVGARHNILWVDDACDFSLRRLLINSKGLISASWAEGFNLPVAEAIILGLPVVVSDIPVHQELYGGKNLLFDPKSIDEISTAIESIFESKDPNHDPANEKYNLFLNYESALGKLSHALERATKV